MVLEDEVSCVVDRLYVYVSVGHDVGVGQSRSKGKEITPLLEILRTGVYFMKPLQQNATGNCYKYITRDLSG